MFKTPNVAAVRVGRLAFGIVMLGGAAVLFFNTAQRIIQLGVWRALSRDVAPLLPMSTTVVGAWLVAIVAGVLAYRLAAWRPGLFRDPGPAVSFAVPAVGVALCLPITVHFAVMMLVGNTTAEFERWASFALPTMVLAHIGFATLVGVRAVRLARGQTPPSVSLIFGLTLLLSGVPFLFLSMIVVAFTAIPIVPLLLAMPRFTANDRYPALPTARVLA